MNTKNAYCPECTTHLKLSGRLHKGQRLVCHACKTGLTITNLNPLEFDVAPKYQAAREKLKPQPVEAPCPECDDFIKLDSFLHEGLRIVCNHCRATLEVVSLDPLELEAPITASIKSNLPTYADDGDDYAGRRSGRTWR